MLSVVDLFAGCGGLGLGLEQAGFSTVFVNEIHDDARQTYLRNRQDNVWLQDPRNQSADIRELTVWPEPQANGGSLHEQWKDIRPAPSERLLEHVDRIRKELGEVTLVTGGPPCQGFSGIGHRRTFALAKGEIPSNYLFRDMITVIQAFGPRGFIFENVRGLLSAQWTKSGRKGEIWDAVLGGFKDLRVKVDGRDLGYRVETRLVRARDYGVPQNRPRVIIIGLREDIASARNLARLPAGEEVGLIPVKGRFERPPHPEELWDDLLDRTWKLGGASTCYNGSLPPEAHPLVKELRSDRDGGYLAEDKLTEQEYSSHSERVRMRFAFLRSMTNTGGELPAELRTKKFAQRVIPARWPDGGPTITATSMPDDYVHFEQDRAPTVREWARLQTFPDWYQFTGRRTTGGRRRAGDPGAGDWSRDLPKFTQIGNAVPVELGRALGEHLRPMLEDSVDPLGSARPDGGVESATGATVPGLVKREAQLQ